MPRKNSITIAAKCAPVSKRPAFLLDEYSKFIWLLIFDVKDESTTHMEVK